MAKKSDFPATFLALKSILSAYENFTDVVENTDSEYTINTPHIMKNGKPLFFGMVKIGKNYVGYHLMPVYVFPELLKDISSELEKRMQGKSCFNFKSPENILSQELETLTRACFQAYKNENYL